ncbi:MAG: DUF29 domain-containing protein [Methylococcaceae bacterium]|nr:DUF29 domain-containing protein [Methylococcaceae bacterium]MDD1616368.1 DUF29 domain-containing protein [Methylococcaceae bacterium]
MIDYQTDYYGWTVEQAELLKTGHWQEIDIKNLIEEVESMGRSEKRSLESRMIVLITHLLKWQYQPVRRGKSWELTIKGQRVNCLDVLEDNPSLKSKLDELFIKAYYRAKLEAAKETGLDEDYFPEECPYTLSQLFDSNYYPD